MLTRRIACVQIDYKKKTDTKLLMSKKFKIPMLFFDNGH